MDEKDQKIADLRTLQTILVDNEKKLHEEHINRIASALRIEVQDFKSALDMEMTPELGECLRFQIQNIFRILKKNGVNLDI